VSWAVQPVVHVLGEVGGGDAVGGLRIAVAALAEVLLRAVDQEEVGVGASSHKAGQLVRSNHGPCMSGRIWPGFGRALCRIVPHCAASGTMIVSCVG